jgi:hypothetical protein
MNDLPRCPHHKDPMTELENILHEDSYRCPVGTCKIRWNPSRAFFFKARGFQAVPDTQHLPFGKPMVTGSVKD